MYFSSNIDRTVHYGAREGKMYMHGSISVEMTWRFSSSGRDAKAREAKARNAKACEAKARETKARNAKVCEAKAQDAKAVRRRMFFFHIENLQ